MVMWHSSLGMRSYYCSLLYDSFALISDLSFTLVPSRLYPILFARCSAAAPGLHLFWHIRSHRFIPHKTDVALLHISLRKRGPHCSLISDFYLLTVYPCIFRSSENWKQTIEKNSKSKL